MYAETEDYSDLESDVLVYSRPYSSLRRGNMKWVGQVLQTAVVPVTKNAVAIPRNFNYVEVYRTQDLFHRTLLKQSPVLFSLFQRIWRLLNPFHIKALSKRVLRAFNEFLYDKIFGPVPELSQAKPLAIQDADIDLRGKPGLPFCDFYDSLFEAVDNWAKSKLITEYALIARRIIQGLEQATWLNSLELHSKVHILQSPSHQYSPWMQKLLKITGRRQHYLSSPTSPKAKIKTISRELSTPRQFPVTETKVSYRKDVFLTKVQALSRTTTKQSYRRKDLDLSAPTGVSVDRSENHVSSPKDRLRIKEAKLQVLTPISTVQKKAGKLPTLIEEVMVQREHKRESSEFAFQFE